MQRERDRRNDTGIDRCAQRQNGTCTNNDEKRAKNSARRTRKKEARKRQEGSKKERRGKGTEKNVEEKHEDPLSRVNRGEQAEK